MSDAPVPKKPWWLLVLVAGAVGIIVYAALPATVPDVSVLNGAWIREDGGYTLEVKNAVVEGSVQVTYLNPKPIRVASANAIRGVGAVQLSVELRDEGYPGSTYSLEYDPKSDRLLGIYFQAGEGQRFNVSFARRK